MLSDLELGFCQKQYWDTAAGRYKPSAARFGREFNKWCGFFFLLLLLLPRLESVSAEWNTYPFRLSVCLRIYPSVSANSVTTKLRLSNTRHEDSFERSVIFSNRRRLFFSLPPPPFVFFSFPQCVWQSLDRNKAKLKFKSRFESRNPSSRHTTSSRYGEIPVLHSAFLIYLLRPSWD